MGRWVTYVGVLLAAGGVAFLVFAHDRRVSERASLRRIVSLAGLAGGVATVVGVFLQGGRRQRPRRRGPRGPSSDWQVLASNFGLAIGANYGGRLAGPRRLASGSPEWLTFLRWG